MFDLNALAEATCANAGAAVLGSGVEFEFIADVKPLQVRGDPIFVAEAIKNLIDNALQHGGPDLGAIRVLTSNDSEFATVTVLDDGVGLSPDQQAKAFSRFGQIEPSSGSGLGLAIVSSVADSHGGRLTIDSVPDGASLTLSLPLADTPQ